MLYSIHDTEHIHCSYPWYRTHTLPLSMIQNSYTAPIHDTEIIYCHICDIKHIHCPICDTKYIHCPICDTEHIHCCYMWYGAHTLLLYVIWNTYIAVICDMEHMHCCYMWYGAHTLLLYVIWSTCTAAICDMEHIHCCYMWYGAHTLLLYVIWSTYTAPVVVLSLCLGQCLQTKASHNSPAWKPSSATLTYFSMSQIKILDFRFWILTSDTPSYEGWPFWLTLFIHTAEFIKPWGMSLLAMFLV